MDEGGLATPFSLFENLDPQDQDSYTGQVTLTDLTPGAKYGFYTTASNSIGESDQSQEVRFAAAELPGKPNSIRRHADTSMT